MYGRWLLLARVAWGLVALLAVAVFVAGLPAYYEQLRALSGPIGAFFSPEIEDPASVRANLARLGLSASFYAAYIVALEVLLTSAFCAVGVVIFWSKSDDWMALLGSIALVLQVGEAPTLALAAAHPAWWFPVDLLGVLAVSSFILFFYLFPDGRFVPRWTRWIAVVGVLLTASFTFFPGWNARYPYATIVILYFAGLLITLVFAQLYRYVRVSGPVERQQTKWVVFGLTTAVVGVLGLDLLSAVTFPALDRTGTPADLVGQTAENLFVLLVPVSIGFAVLRYRLWDIDILINRTLVYGTLTISVVGLYVLVVGLLGALLHERGNILVSLLAAGLVAVLFAPLRERLQRGVNRLMYGDRDDPYAALSRLGRRLEGTLSPEAVLPAIVENVARALRLPHAEIWLADDDALRLGAAHGSGVPSETTVRDADAGEKLRRAADGLNPADLGPSSPYGAVLAQNGAALVLPLTHRGELVGALCVAPRGPDEDFSPADRRLLRDLATQSGAAAHAVRLTVALRSSLEDLRRSRERLVAAQEEERRRIQRDLHDGLGPVLASMRLRLEACLDATQEARDPLADDLERLYELVGQATGDIRRLVYDLRPPVLDQLGLVPALRQHCERFSRDSGVEVRFEAEDRLPIPAAAEVALLRVAQEALHNVGKHARASRADVRLTRSDGWLELKVRDDGAGFGTNGHLPEGTGIGSMRERAELLGGTLHVDSRPGAGARVTVRIPAEGAPG